MSLAEVVEIVALAGFGCRIARKVTRKSSSFCLSSLVDGNGLVCGGVNHVRARTRGVLTFAGMSNLFTTDQHPSRLSQTPRVSE